MIIYHGTSTKHVENIINKGFKKKTWFALFEWHAYQLALRTSKRDGGVPCVLEIDITNCERVIGRNKPSFQYNGEKYKILNKLFMIRSQSF